MPLQPGPTLWHCQVQPHRAAPAVAAPLTPCTVHPACTQLKGLSKSAIEEEVVGARTELAECGVPEKDIVGLRCAASLAPATSSTVPTGREPRHGSVHARRLASWSVASVRLISDPPSSHVPPSTFLPLAASSVCPSPTHPHIPPCPIAPHPAVTQVPLPGDQARGAAGAGGERLPVRQVRAAARRAGAARVCRRCAGWRASPDATHRSRHGLMLTVTPSCCSTPASPRSTLIEEPSGYSLSSGPGSRIWPWNMENGIPINCAFYSSIQTCTDNERYDLWQIPLWPLNDYTMDYGE